MNTLLNTTLLLAFLAAPVIASDDAPTCPSCPKKGDKEAPAALFQDDCDKGCDKDKKKDCDKDDCSASQDDCGGCKKGKKKECDKEEAPASA